MRHVLPSFFLLLALATPAHADCTSWEACEAQGTAWGACAVVAGLPGWWRMAGATFAPCGTITDSSGHGNTATCVGAPTYAVPYSGVGALALNGTSQKATVSNSTSFNSLSSLTISVWIKAPANSMVSFARIVEKGTNTEWALLVNNNSGTDNTVWFQGLSAHLCLGTTVPVADGTWQDRKSTRLNSSHRCISYAVFCLNKKCTKDRPYGRRTTRAKSGRRRRWSTSS